MKSTGGYAIAALVLAALGAVALAGGLVEHRIADAEEMLASLNFVETAAAYDELEQYVGYARYVPWIAGDAFNRMRARRAAVRYWDGDYEPLAAVTRDANAGEETDTDVLFTTANAIYRLGHARAVDRESLLRALDEARGAYLVVLRDSAGHPDAAFNYEYLGFVRDEVAKGRRRAFPGSLQGSEQRAGSGQTLHGREGAPPSGRSDDEFKVYVPAEPEERPKGTEPGSDQLRRRKG